jgi:hypothetical protein
MALTPSQGPVIQVKAQPDIYTVLLIVGIIGLAMAIAFSGWKLTASVDAGGYGMTVGQLFDALPNLAR